MSKDLTNQVPLSIFVLACVLFGLVYASCVPSLEGRHPRLLRLVHQK